MIKDLRSSHISGWQLMLMVGLSLIPWDEVVAFLADLGGAGAAAEDAAPWFQVTKAGANRAGTFVPESFDLSVAGEDLS